MMMSMSLNTARHKKSCRADSELVTLILDTGGQHMYKYFRGGAGVAIMMMIALNH